MAKRRIVTIRQRRAARLLLCGYSGVCALREAGFGKSYARNLGRALDRSWGLREALREESEAQGWNPRLRRERRHTYDKRRTARAIMQIALLPEAGRPSKAIQPPHTLSKEIRELRERVNRPPQLCANCGQETKELFLDRTGSVYLCRPCAGF